MIQVLHNLLQFIWRYIINICICIWIVLIIMGIFDIKERLDIIEKDNKAIMERILSNPKAMKDLKPIEPMDTIKVIPHGNRDGWKGLKRL